MSLAARLLLVLMMLFIIGGLYVMFSLPSSLMMFFWLGLVPLLVGIAGIVCIVPERRRKEYNWYR